MRSTVLGVLALALIGLVACNTPSSTEVVPDEVLSTETSASVASIGKGKSHGKANGDVTYRAGNGDLVDVVFDAHDDAPGSQGDRGEVNFSRPSGALTVAIDCVVIDGNKATFSGENVGGTGIYGPGQPRGPGARIVYEVVDNGTPGRRGDTFRGAVEQSVHEASPRPANNCPGGVDPSLDRFPVVDGNLKVH